MDDVLRVQLPADLADELIDKGFDEYVVFRGILADAGTVMTVAFASLAVGANVATILVSREALGEFVAAIRDWVQRRAAGQADGELTIDISAKRRGTEIRMRVKVVSANGTPQIDASALSAFMASLFPDRPEECPITLAQRHPEVET